MTADGTADLAPLTMPTGRYETSYHRTGAGREPAALFLHGSGPGVTAMANWRFALPELADRYDCLAPDLQGFGASEHPLEPPQGTERWLDVWVAQLVALLDGLGLERVHLVGNSMGGAIALHVVDRAPERVDRVVLMGPLGAPMPISDGLAAGWGFYRDPDLGMLTRLMRGFVYDPAILGGAVEQIAAERWSALMEPTVRRSFEAMFPGDLQEAVDELVLDADALAAIEHRTLLVHGRDDPYVPLDTSLYLLRALPRAQLHVFERCAHWVQIERRAAFHELIDRFFAGALD